MTDPRQAQTEIDGPRVPPRLPISDGVICRNCGGLMIRTGACHTCTGCGDTDGCG